jgi:hypothetical protein
MKPGQRIRVLVFIVSVLLLSWLLLQAVHELGHVLAAWMTGGTVQRVVLDPLTISRTDVDPNPQPLVVTWAGPLFGSLTPLAVWALLEIARARLAWLARFFAGACLLANGLYLGAGSFDAVGDAGDIIRHGSPTWTLWLFGLVTAPAGLWLWNGLGPKFGLGPKAEEVSGRLVLATLAALLATCGIMLITSS